MANVPQPIDILRNDMSGEFDEEYSNSDDIILFGSSGRNTSSDYSTLDTPPIASSSGEYIHYDSETVDSIRNFSEDERPRLMLQRTDAEEIQRQIVFVDPKSREVLKSMGQNKSLKPVNMITKNTIMSISEETNLIVSPITLEVTLPKISTDTTRSIGSTRYSNTSRVSAVIPTVSHILKTSGGDRFISGSGSRRIRGGETKNLCGINGIWYET